MAPNVSGSADATGARKRSSNETADSVERTDAVRESHGQADSEFSNDPDSGEQHVPGTGNGHGNRELTQALIEKLLDQGRRQGFLTVEEVADAVGTGRLCDHRIEEVKAIFGEQGISVVPAGETPPNRTRPTSTNRSIEEIESTNDPVRVYLREMGQVSLLTREGEVEIAKRIEAGLHDRMLAVIGTPRGLRVVLEIAERGQGERARVQEGG